MLGWAMADSERREANAKRREAGFILLKVCAGNILFEEIGAS